jgi:hypothetical protein
MSPPGRPGPMDATFVLGNGEKVEILEIIPPDCLTQPYEWWLKMARLRGSMLRRFLERGVTWRELEPAVRNLSETKKAARRVVERMCPPTIIKVRRVP